MEIPDSIQLQQNDFEDTNEIDFEDGSNEVKFTVTDLLGFDEKDYNDEKDINKDPRKDESSEYSRQLKTYAKRGQLKQAELYFKQLTHPNHFVATVEMFNTMLSLYASQHEHQEEQERNQDGRRQLSTKLKATFKQLQESGLSPNTTTYDIVLFHLKNTGARLKEVEEVFEEFARKSGLRPPKKDKVTAFTFTKLTLLSEFFRN